MSPSQPSLTVNIADAQSPPVICWIQPVGSSTHPATWATATSSRNIAITEHRLLMEAVWHRTLMIWRPLLKSTMARMMSRLIRWLTISLNQ